MTEMTKNPNPTKDQHFMVDKEMIEKICRKANIQEGETIVEIGGGAGALTEVLAQMGNQLTVIELDHYYAELLREKFRQFANVTIVEDNALNLTYNSYDRLVANLPYTITEPFLMNLARSGALYVDKKDQKSSNIKSVTLVVSQNSTRKMVAPIQITEGKSRHLNQEFGLISAICQCCLEVDIDEVIPSKAFFPEPAVTSFLVNLIPKRKKTTVDRIVCEMLMDRTGRSPSVDRVYQLMLAQGKIYKLNKHKGNFSVTSKAFTSRVIGNSSIYDLSNNQISQLIKDLIRNDSNQKGAKMASCHREEDSYQHYLRTGEYALEMDEDFDEEDTVVVTKAQRKSEEKHEYLYNETRYNVLLHRGLEFRPTMELKQLLAN